MGGTAARSYWAALLAFSLVIGTQPASAQRRDPDNPTCPPNLNVSTYREMRFTLLERPDEAPVLLAEGAIDENMMPRLEAALAGFEGREIRLRSPGGYDDLGIEAARLIRQRGLTTRIPADWACLGGCSFMFLGGTSRSVEAGGLFVVQMFTTVDDPAAVTDLGEVANRAAMIATADYDFMIRMGVSPRLLGDIVYRQSARPTADNRATRRCLTPEELSEYRVVTE
jgi:hypothetical protein